MISYTPLDLGKISRIHSANPTPQESLFDRFFFPFSLSILIFALSFYTYKVVTEAKNAQTEVKTISQVTNITPTVEASPTVAQPRIYHTVGDIHIDIQKMFDTAQVKYPNVDNAQIIDIVNQNILQFAALRSYSASDSALLQKLSINTTMPVATYSAILRDLAVLTADYDQHKRSVSQKTVVELTEEYMRNTMLEK